MNIYLWITVLVFLVYFALVYTANKTGWLEKHNMSLALGFILMWRTQRGKELIERVSGRASEMEVLRTRIKGIEGEIRKTRESLEPREPEEGEGASEAPLSPAQREAAESRVEEAEGELSEARGELEVLRASAESPVEERKASRRRRFWRAYGNVAIGLVLFFMMVMFGLLVWQSFLVVRIPPGVISPAKMLGIPGVNPVIPLWYGIFGLAVAMFVHELAHGILARVGRIAVKSLGLLFVVVPVGAFVEPDEEELSSVDRARRARVFAVGPATNIIVALVVVMVFAWGFMGSLEPAKEGVVLNDIKKEQYVTLENGSRELRETPAFRSGLKSWSILTEMEALDGLPLGEDGGNVSRIRDNEDFHETMDRTQGGQRVRLRWYFDGRFREAEVELWDRGDVFDIDHGQGYLGAVSSLIPEVPAKDYPEVLAHPMRYADDGMAFRNITFLYISLPFSRTPLQPAPDDLTQAFEVTGPLSALGDTGFWFVANLLYWIFWLNLMVGIFNALPAIPLDGGYIFRDGLSWLLQKLMPGKERAAVDGIALKVTLVLSVLILVLILWQFIGPWVGAMVGL